MKNFEDRKEAGRRLGESLRKYKFEKPIILAIPRGGVLVGYEVAKALDAPFDVIISRKIGVPYQPELGMGAVAEGNIEILDKKLIKSLRIPKNLINEIIIRERAEIDRRKKLYRGNKPMINMENKVVILVDDGLATGVSAKAAITRIKKLRPKKIIFASPVCAQDSLKSMKHYVDEIFCISTPSGFDSVGKWYTNFEQVTDEEVKSLLKESSNLQLNRGSYSGNKNSF